MTAKRERQLKQLAYVINGIVLADLVVYYGSQLFVPATVGNVGFAVFSIFLPVLAACALANLVVLTPLVTRAKSIKQWQHRFALLLLAVSALYLAFIILPLGAGLV